MRVIHLISSSGYYGAENMLANLLVGLRDLQTSVSLCVFDNMDSSHFELASRAASLRIAVEHIQCQGRIDLAAIAKLRTCLKLSSADILHTHGYKANIYGYLATRNSATTLISTCHNWTQASPSLRLYARLDKFALRTFDSVVAVSPQVADELRKSGLSESRVEVIANGVPTPPADVHPEARLSERRHVVIGMATRLVREKGIEDFLYAARLILSEDDSIRFIIAGEGPERASFEAEAARYSISEQVTFLGFTVDMPAFYESIDIFVLPSLREGLPMSLLEALAVGKAVIATRVGAIPSVIQHERSGLLIDAGDKESLTASLMQLARDRSTRERLGSNAVEAVRSSYSAANMCRLYLSLYERVHCARCQEPLRRGLWLRSKRA